MEALPSKSESERIIFAVDYGDDLPLGSILTSAWIYVSVHSGIDENPKRLYRRVFARIGTLVLYQVGAGIPGVVYNLETVITSGDIQIARNFKLAITPDAADTGNLYPLTRSVTTQPYAQIYYDATVSSLVSIFGELTTVVVEGVLPTDSLSIGMRPIGGSLLLPGTGLMAPSIMEGTLLAYGGILKLPPSGTVAVSNATGALIAYGGILKIPPSGTMAPSNTESSLIPIGGTLA